MLAHTRPFLVHAQVTVSHVLMMRCETLETV